MNPIINNDIYRIEFNDYSAELNFYKNKKFLRAQF